MASPTIGVILALGIFPLLYSLVLSFQRRDLQHPNEDQFVGLANYAAALVDPRVLSAMTNTLLLVVVGIAIQFVLGLGLALVVVDELRGKRFIIPLLMLPVMMVPVVVALGWRLLWDSQYGPINQILSIILRRDVDILWLTQKWPALFAVLVTDVWQWTPFMFLILLAGLSSLNPELYEAAALDGAGWWEELREITLPGLAPVIAVAILFRALDAFKIFDQIFMLTQGQPGTSTETISWYIYQVGYKFFNLGYAAAVSYLLLIFLTVVATIYAGRFLSEERL
ncbi:MAG: sugar transporter permease [Thermomicrobiales bacterium]|jgi:multiple sugar transport system permease protein|nr:sugar transporter permease [Thermomicrobiales bacterium]